MAKFNVRFHLGAGPHFMFWQIKANADLSKANADLSITYLDPKTTEFTIYGAKLCNQQKTAQKIHDGAHKTVCAWISCDRIEVGPITRANTDLSPCLYNPRKCPHWTNDRGENLDKKEFEKLFVIGNKVYANV